MGPDRTLHTGEVNGTTIRAVVFFISHRLKKETKESSARSSGEGSVGLLD